MGTWGPGGFENDTAVDFSAAVSSVEDVERAMKAALDKLPKQITADDGELIIAAAECVATMMGRPPSEIPEQVSKKLGSMGKPSSELTELARNAVAQVLEDSELLDLWAEAEPEPWNRSISFLIDRLNPDPRYDHIASKRKTRKKKAAFVGRCCFCNEGIVAKELCSIKVVHPSDTTHLDDDAYVTGITLGGWCHLICLNGKVHPRHLIQDWRHDPDDNEFPPP